MPRKKAEETEAAVDATPEGGEESSVVETVVETVTSAVEAVTDTITSGAAAVANAITGDGETSAPKKGKRAERIGVVSSDKMTKTVVVNVDRLVKHPIYRKYYRPIANLIHRCRKQISPEALSAGDSDRVFHKDFLPKYKREAMEYLNRGSLVRGRMIRFPCEIRFI